MGIIRLFLYAENQNNLLRRNIYETETKNFQPAFSDMHDYDHESIRLLLEVPYLSINSGTSVISVTDANAEDVLCDGTVSYDRETNTLTLNNAELVPEGSPSAPAIYVSAANKGLNLNIVGKNTISHDQCMSINGQLTISGEGTLDVTGKTYAIMATGGITIDGTVNGQHHWVTGRR